MLSVSRLGARAAQHVIKKVRDAYTTLKANIGAGNLGKPGSRRRIKAETKPIVFRPEAAQPYDDRCLSWQYDAGTVSVWTVDGRVKNLPTGYKAAGRGLNRHRKRQLELRRKLQKKRTKSAKRLLKKRNRGEKRHAANQNHIIAKTIVTEAQRTSSGISLEDLKGIRQRVGLRNIARKGEAVWTAGRESRVPATP